MTLKEKQQQWTEILDFLYSKGILNFPHIDSYKKFKSKVINGKYITINGKKKLQRYSFYMVINKKTTTQTVQTSNKFDISLIIHNKVIDNIQTLKSILNERQRFN